MLNCKQTSELVSQALDRPLSISERWSLRFHLFMCSACTRFSRQLAFMQAAIEKFLSETEQNEQLQLSPAAKARMAELLRSETLESGSK